MTPDEIAARENATAKLVVAIQFLAQWMNEVDDLRDALRNLDSARAEVAALLAATEAANGDF